MIDFFSKNAEIEIAQSGGVFAIEGQGSSVKMAVGKVNINIATGEQPISAIHDLEMQAMQIEQ